MDSKTYALEDRLPLEPQGRDFPFYRSGPGAISATGWLLVLAGVAAGFINSSVALNSGVLHGGMNLYNTGFSAGIVAAFLVPLMDSLAKRKRPGSAVSK